MGYVKFANLNEPKAEMNSVWMIVDHNKIITTLRDKQNKTLNELQLLKYIRFF